MSNKYRGTYFEKVTVPDPAVKFSRVLGYLPNRVKVHNVSSLSSLEWYLGIAADKALLTTASSGAITLISSKGITVGTVTDSVTGKVGKGFTVDVDTTVIIKDEILAITAE